jgi:hypothetical protein
MDRRRAILFVPGYGADARNVQRDVLVESLRMNDTFRMDHPRDVQIVGEAGRRLSPIAEPGDTRPVVDVYEAYWADMVPKTALASPLVRFGRATTLIGFWVLTPWWIRALRANRALTFSMIVTTLLTFVWYVVLFMALIQFVLTSGTDHIGSSLLPADLARDGKVQSVLGNIVVHTSIASAWIATHLPYAPALTALIVVLLRVETMVALIDFARLYLLTGRNDHFDIKLAQRVQDMLEHIYAARAADDSARPLYDEVVVLGHSMGGAIALEALARYGSPEIPRRTTLVTWGSPLAVLSYRSPQRIGANVRRAVGGTVPRWIDLHSPDDWLSTELKPLAEARPGCSIALSFETAWWQGVSATAHAQYFYDDQALTMLLDTIVQPPVAPIVAEAVSVTPEPSGEGATA